MTTDENLEINQPIDVSSENVEETITEDQSSTPVDVTSISDVSSPGETEEPEAPNEDPETSVVEEALETSAQEAEEALAKAKAERERLLKELETQRAKIDLEAQNLTDEINVKQNAAEEFVLWVEKHRRTFLWKMYSKMRQQMQTVKDKQESYSSIMQSIELPQPGELVRLRKRFHKTLLTAIGVGLLVWLVYFLITNYVPFAWALKLTSFGGMILRYTLSSIVVTIFSSLILYYRDWRRFDWRVKTLNSQLGNVAKGVDKVRQEEVRLVSLYPQVKDWLQIIGYSLNRPWTMNDRWFRSYLSDLNQDEFPFSLRIAQAQESDASSMNQLQGRAIKRFAVRGWRTKVLNDQVLAIAQKVGLPVERMNVDSIDRDISYSPGGPRNELRKGLENQEALELVARRQLIPLTFKVQSEEITKSRPPVKENRTNLLDAIQADQAGLEEEEKVDWDKFLQEPIGPFNGVVTPFSVASLASGKVGQGYHEKMKSHFVVPERLADAAKSNPDARVETYSESANLPMDIVIRMDLSDVLPPNAIRINPKSEETIVTRKKLADDEEDED
jgi:hypothetical protein